MGRGTGAVGRAARASQGLPVAQRGLLAIIEAIGGQTSLYGCGRGGHGADPFSFASRARRGTSDEGQQLVVHEGGERRSGSHEDLWLRQPLEPV